MQAAVVAVGLWMVQVGATPATPAQSAAQDTSVNQSFGPEIQFDTKGVEFGPWIRRFIAQVKRNWLIPPAAMNMSGHVAITFNVHKDGAITDLAVVGPCPIDAFNDAAFGALFVSNPTEPMPPEYPSENAFFTVTFYYNEQPPKGAAPTPSAGVLEDVPPANRADSLLGKMASEVEDRNGKPAQVDGLRWTYMTERGILYVYFDGAQVVIDVRPPWFDLTIFKK